MPPLKYWLIEAIEQATISRGFQITIDTDVACHVWLRYTSVKPEIHFEPRLRRGIQIFTDYRFCFVAYTDLEQDEAGDTFHHTFTWTGWEVCQFKYFYFWATNQSEAMISTTCTFYKHKSPPLLATDFEHYYNAQDSKSALLLSVIVAQGFTPQFNQSITDALLRLQTFNEEGFPLSLDVLVKLVKDNEGLPTGDTLALKAETLLAPIGLSDFYWKEFHLGSIPVLQDTLYWLTASQIPEGSTMPYAWWAETNLNPYPRGIDLRSENWGITWDPPVDNPDAFFITQGFLPT